MENLNPDIFDAWGRKAEEDFTSASLLLANGGPPATICFLCQQTAETKTASR